MDVIDFRYNLCIVIRGSGTGRDTGSAHQWTNYANSSWTNRCYVVPQLLRRKYDNLKYLRVLLNLFMVLHACKSCSNMICIASVYFRYFLSLSSYVCYVNPFLIYFSIEKLGVSLTIKHTTITDMSTQVPSRVSVRFCVLETPPPVIAVNTHFDEVHSGNHLVCNFPLNSPHRKPTQAVASVADHLMFCGRDDDALHFKNTLTQLCSFCWRPRQL